MITKFEKLLNLYTMDILAFSWKLNATYWKYLKETSVRGSEKIKLNEEQYVYDNEQAQQHISRINLDYENLMKYVREGNIKVAKNLKEGLLDAIECLEEDSKNADKLGTVILNQQQIINFSNTQIKNLQKLLKTLKFIKAEVKE